MANLQEQILSRVWTVGPQVGSWCNSISACIFNFFFGLFWFSNDSFSSSFWMRFFVVYISNRLPFVYVCVKKLSEHETMTPFETHSVFIYSGSHKTPKFCLRCVDVEETKITNVQPLVMQHILTHRLWFMLFMVFFSDCPMNTKTILVKKKVEDKKKQSQSQYKFLF